jgi:hypothetical protein
MDGTWSKRGHTANYGFGFVISVETGEVLDYGFRSKVCTACNKQKADKESNEYKEWYTKHQCATWKCQLQRNCGNGHLISRCDTNI